VSSHRTDQAPSDNAAANAADLPAETPGLVVSAELRAPVSTGIELCYQTYARAATTSARSGRPDDPALLLVMGLAGPMTWWDDRLCRRLAQQGFFVVRYDNRDVGRSGHGAGRVTRKDLVRAFLGLPGRAPYTMSDLAADAVGLLDHLGIDRAHLVGVSMGGMIVQTVAIEHPARVASLVSIMSTTGRRSVGWQHPSLFPRLLAKRPRTRDDYVAQAVVTGRMIGSPGFPESEDEARARAGETWDRGLNPPGVLRQMLAVLRQPNRTRELRALRVPAAVIHGTADKMVHVSGGRATAAAIPGAELVLVDGMGHDLPPALYDTYVDVIRRTAARATPDTD
jgi:pimeloyl-ACP methyl ester carboxylesterase